MYVRVCRMIRRYIKVSQIFRKDRSAICNIRHCSFGIDYSLSLGSWRLDNIVIMRKSTARSSFILTSPESNCRGATNLFGLALEYVGWVTCCVLTSAAVVSLCVRLLWRGALESHRWLETDRIGKGAVRYRASRLSCPTRKTDNRRFYWHRLPDTANLILTSGGWLTPK